MQTAYLDVVAMIESLHRRFLEVMKLELETLGVRDINNVQAMILFNVGDLQMTVSELTLRGCYLGSNVSYNVKKLVEADYLVQERSAHDQRCMHVRLSDKGQALRQKIVKMHERHVEALSKGSLKEQDLTNALAALRRLDRFWTTTVTLGPKAMDLDPAAFGPIGDFKLQQGASVQAQMRRA
jgi:DNA-binding MarR family transcriptional regulator